MKYIILGDLHFGVKKFSLEFFANQMKFFENQLIPYMRNHNITTIIQTGDFLDNRTIIDINFFNLLRNKFFKLIVDNDIKIITYLGNHDLYYKNTRDTNLVELLQELYPHNINVIREQTLMSINNTDVGFIPFLLPNEDVDDFILYKAKYLFGHFEVAGFQIAKGITDTHSELKVSTFKENSGLKGVFSGHYHIQDTSDFVKFVGVPYNINWGDHGNPCGFHVMDENFDIEFIENTESIKYVKIIYDGTISIDNIEVEDFNYYIKSNPNIEVKLYLFNMNQDDDSYLGLTDILRGNNISFSITDNREELNPINLTTEVVESIEKSYNNVQSTDVFLHEFIRENHADLYDIFLDLIKEQGE